MVLFEQVVDFGRKFSHGRFFGDAMHGGGSFVAAQDGAKG
jgi:hypothetical protein